MVLEYLRARGHKDPEKILEEIEKASTPPADEGKQPEAPSFHTISHEELVKQLAIFAQKAANPDENALEDSSNVLQELSTLGNPQNINNLLSSIGSVGAEEILSLDPTDKHEGFRELESWVDGSLDMYRVGLQQSYEFMCGCSCVYIHEARVSTHSIPYILPLLLGFSPTGLPRSWCV